MKMIKNFKLWLFSLIFLFSCGKPNDPESLIPPDISGGYKIVNKFVTSGYAQDVLKKDNLLYIAQGEGGLMILDVADPLNPEIVSVTTDDVRGYNTSLAMKDTAVYLAAGGFGLNVVDISDPLFPEVTATNVGVKPATSFALLGDYLLVAIGEKGVGIAEISDPTTPDVKGEFSISGYANGLAINDTSLLLVACGEMGMSIYNISDFQQGYGIYPHVGWCDTPGYAESIKIRENDSIAFLACGTAGLQIIDYSDTSNIFIAGSYDASGYAKDLEYKDNLVFMTTELSGLQIINVSNITNPTLVGIVDTEYALGLDLDENYIYLADDIEGIIIISIPD
jgi:hypothetical protein